MFRMFNPCSTIQWGCGRHVQGPAGGLQGRGGQCIQARGGRELYLLQVRTALSVSGIQELSLYLNFEEKNKKYIFLNFNNIFRISACLARSLFLLESSTQNNVKL